MIGLTNEQRLCFGLEPIRPDWQVLRLKPSPYDTHESYAFLEGSTVRKCILIGPRLYREYALNESLSEDLRYLLPKTTKGKPALLTASSLSKRTGVSMHLYYEGKRSSSVLALYSEQSQRNYYTSIYEGLYLEDLEAFYRWAEQWRRETTSEDLEDIHRFAALPRTHVKFREGDVFRFKLTRRLYGYGRVLLDYAQMRKNREPFWDRLMSRPVVCSAYHIVTENAHLTVHDLAGLKSLPSSITADNHLYYGEYEIIGHLPIGPVEDYPIMYGESRSPGKGNTVHLQRGKQYLTLANGKALYMQFENNAVSFDLNVRLPTLLDCIAQNSNDPYWEQTTWIFCCEDLRNPKYRTQWAAIRAQFGL